MENNNAQQEEVKQPEVQQEQVEQEQPKTKPQEENDDKHQQLYPYSNETLIKNIQELLEKEKDNEKLLKQIRNSLPIPPAIYSKVVKFFQNMEKYIAENGEDSVSDKERIVLEDIRNASMYTLFQDMFYNNLNKNPENFVNDVHFAGKEINIKPAKITKTEGGEVGGVKAINMFRSLVSVGELIQLPLWHSGFWILIKPPTQAEIANLQTALTSNEIRLGRETNTLVYSNYSVIINRIVTDFIMDHISQTSIKGWEELDLREYISIHDFYILACGMLATMAPEGLNIVKYCSNATVTDDSGKPLCDFFVTGIVDPKKLIWVNRQAVTPKMMSHMLNNKFQETMTVDMVKDYQLNLASLTDKTIEITLDNGNKFEVTYTFPTLRDHLVNGEAWVEDIKATAESMFTEADDNGKKNEKIDALTFASILGIYNTFIKSFKLPTGELITDTTTFKEILSDLSLDDSAFNGITSTLGAYINESPIAIVATPTYTCPKCNKQQKEGATGPFKEFVPLDIISHFFALCGLRSRIVQQRSF